MKKARLLFAVLGATVAMLGPGAAQRAELPVGPNREIQTNPGYTLSASGRSVNRVKLLQHNNFRRFGTPMH